MKKDEIKVKAGKVKVGVFKPNHCKKCGEKLGKLNKSGLCRSCYTRKIGSPRMQVARKKKILERKRKMNE